MLSRIGRSVLIRQSSSAIRQNLKNLYKHSTRCANVIEKSVPEIQTVAVRAFATQQVDKVTEPLTIKLKLQQQQHNQAQKTSRTPQHYFNSLVWSENTGNVKNAINVVREAQEKGEDSEELYIDFLKTLNNLPFATEEYAVVAKWFYSPETPLSKNVLESKNVWIQVLKLGLGFASTYRVEDLRALIKQFEARFDLDTMNNQEAWQLLIRAYGVLNKADKVNGISEKIMALLSKQNDHEQNAKFYHYALMAHAEISNHNEVDELLKKMKEHGLLSRRTLLRLIRCYGFNGDIEHTKKYTELCDQLFPEKEKCDKSMLLIAHRVALEKYHKHLITTRGVRGLKLKPNDTTALNKIHASWDKLTKDMFSNNDKDSTPVHITDCNNVIAYLTIANHIDPIQFPLEKAEEIFNTYMPNHYVQPDDVTYYTMLRGYARTQQYNDGTRNIRLNKTLQMLERMQVEGVDTANSSTFHALFRACIPHQDGKYYFDHFKLKSSLPARPNQYYRFHLDHRLFEIEKIMLEAEIPHDRYTILTMMTCLAAAGQYKALYTRWRSLAVNGIRRDMDMYRHMFSLCSLEVRTANKALMVLRNEMAREIPKQRQSWDTYVALLDCCITLQRGDLARTIASEMMNAQRVQHKKRTHPADLAKWPAENDPQYYAPLLRVAVAIPNSISYKDLVSKMDNNNVEYNQGIWEALLSKPAIDGDIDGVRQIFNKYTMYRFEKLGKIPTPVRNEPGAAVIPFPTAPYNTTDMQFIDMFMASTVDLEDISLVFDCLRTLKEQTNIIGLSRRTLLGITRLAIREKSYDNLKYLGEEILPCVPYENQTIRKMYKKINYHLQKV
ncbi:hypothetical protein BDF20DRAFT_961892 [Mycotypha africana]|uniref:uncharacterized protein n=1 Tax=Mycotypha africana TaxID=64632 RepID=UPI0022FFEC2D|nr:uncharacterized protein BDF20DRAFT_961892 [Mycotypha africana]KAI8971774.1 hypothetical protein BDF20DRAFT_961892 [Mycotypha africana]